MPLPQLQKKAPDFTGLAVIDENFVEVSLRQFHGTYLILLFYPMDFTFVCPTELVAFSDNIHAFRKLDCEILACSTDSQFTHLAWMNTPRNVGGLGAMDIAIIADKSGKICKDYGVMNEDTGVPYRGLFIIDRKSILRQITVNDLPIGRSVDETLRLVQALQHTDVYGEVCPVNWVPGNKAIKPDVHLSKEYFQQAFMNNETASVQDSEG